MRLNEAQLACLASPACSTVFTILRGLGRASASEIATKVGKSAATVIYHLRRLEDAGLIEIVERRAAKRKPEAIYQSVEARYERPPGRESRELKVRAVQASLRLASRGWERASLAESGSMHIIRAQIRLSAEDLRQFESMLEAASKFAIGHEAADGVLHYWTSVVYPDA